MKYWHLIIIMTLALALNLVSSSNSIGKTANDSFNELITINSIVENGWEWRSANQHNNTSLVIGFIVPTITKAFPISPVDILKYILPIFCSLSPLLLYLLYRRYLSPSKSFVAALLFVMIPPTYMEVPTIGKSMVAEPLAIGALLLLTSNRKLVVRIPMLSALIILTLWCHYTIGFLLLAWLGGFILTNSRKIVNSIPLIIGVTFGYFYFSLASNGIIMSGLLYWNDTPQPVSDIVHQLLLFQPITQKAVPGIISLIEGFTSVQLLTARIVIYSIALLGILGIAYIIKHREWQKLQGTIGMLVVSTALVTLALFVPVFSRNLFLTRWIQIEGIMLCLLFGYGSYLVPRLTSYLLLGLLTIPIVYLWFTTSLF